MSGKRVIQVGAGYYISGFLTDEGIAYTSGSGFYGDGRGGTVDTLYPTPITMNGSLAGKSIVSIHGMDRNFLMLTSDGLVCKFSNFVLTYRWIWRQFKQCSGSGTSTDFTNSC